MFSDFAVLLIDDDVFVQQALSHLMQRSFPRSRISTAQAYEDGMTELKKGNWNVVLLDLSLGRESGLTLLREFRTFDAKTPVLVLSSQKEEETATPVLQNGANGYLCKDHAISGKFLENAVNTILAGRTYLSEEMLQRLVKSQPLPEEPLLSSQETSVLCLLGAGKAVKEVSASMNISEKTVRTYRMRLMDKLELSSDTDIVRYALKNGLVD